MAVNILGVGIATLDIINSVDHYPAEDEEMRAVAQRSCRGGNVTNSLAVLSQAGHRCYWCGVLSDESDGDIIKNDLAANRINYKHAQIVPGGKVPTSYITLNQHNGSRTIVHYRDLPELSFDHFQHVPIEPFDWIHFEARVIPENLKMINWIKHQYPDKTVSIEIEKPREGVEQILQAADIYFYSKHYAQAIGYQSGEEFIRWCGDVQSTKHCICTWGEKGAYAISKDGEYLHVPAADLDNIIDTIGAGDTFNAGMIHSLSQQLSLKASLEFANQLAAKKCAQEGFNNLL